MFAHRRFQINPYAISKFRMSWTRPKLSFTTRLKQFYREAKSWTIWYAFKIQYLRQNIKLSNLGHKKRRFNHAVKGFLQDCQEDKFLLCELELEASFKTLQIFNCKSSKNGLAKLLSLTSLEDNLL